MKKVFISGVFLAVIALGVACSNEESTPMTDGNSKTTGNVLTKMDLDKPFTLTYSNEDEKDAIMTDLIAQIDAVVLKIYPDTGNGVTSDEFSLGIVDNGFGGLNITPFYGTVPVPVTSGDADSDCGDGKGWKNFGSTSSSNKDKIKQLSKAAAAHFEDDIKESGDCLDVRIRKVSGQATICARLIKC